MGRLSLLAALSMVGALVFAPAAFAQADLNCGDFPSQAAAQAELDSDTTDPNNLDSDDDLEACETFDYGDSTASPMAEETASPMAEEEEPATAMAEEEEESATATASASAEPVEDLPDTGGVSPALLTVLPALMLVGSGVVAVGVVRRT